MEKHLEREKGGILAAGGRRDEESLRALAVEDAHILSAMSSTFLHLLLLLVLLLLATTPSMEVKVLKKAPRLGS